MYPNPLFLADLYVIAQFKALEVYCSKGYRDELLLIQLLHLIQLLPLGGTKWEYAVDFYHARLFQVDISSEVWNSRCTLHWISHQTMMIKPCYNFLNILPGANGSICNIRIYIHWEKLSQVLATEVARIITGSSGNNRI